MTTKTQAEKITFKKEWTPEDFKRMKRALKSFFLLKGLQSNKGFKICYSYSDIESFFGLPYTSSSEYAGQWVTNSEVYSNDHSTYHYVGFAISEDNKPYAILWDKNENEILQPLK